MKAVARRPLTSSEATASRSELCCWQTPDDFGAVVSRLWNAHGDYLLTERGTSFWREAWGTHKFGTLRGVDRIRLVRDDRPDFEISVGCVEYAFEFTEADKAGRRRNDEIRDDRGWSGEGPLVKDFPYEEWLTAEAAGEALRSAAKRKADARYSSSTSLLIYLNGMEFDVHRHEIEALMADATQAAAKWFAEVWVLWSGRAYNTWAAGRPTSLLLEDSSKRGEQ